MLPFDKNSLAKLTDEITLLDCACQEMERVDAQKSLKRVANLFDTDESLLDLFKVHQASIYGIPQAWTRYKQNPDDPVIEEDFSIKLIAFLQDRKAFKSYCEEYGKQFVEKNTREKPQEEKKEPKKYTAKSRNRKTPEREYPPEYISPRSLLTFGRSVQGLIDRHGIKGSRETVIDRLNSMGNLWGKSSRPKYTGKWIWIHETALQALKKYKN